MDIIKGILISSLLFIMTLCGTAQEIPENAKLVGGFCQGCEAVFEFGDRELTATDTLPVYDRPGPKLKVTGTIYQSDGKTPAANVILYIHHTNQKGIYETRGDETGWARSHGFIRGWIKTGKDGTYTFYTIKPGAYPSRSQPAHIHPILLEPDGKYYWLGSYFFDDDPLLTKSYRQDSENSPRGGTSGVMKLKKEGDLLVAERDFILGLNVPNYE